MAGPQGQRGLQTGPQGQAAGQNPFLPNSKLSPGGLPIPPGRFGTPGPTGQVGVEGGAPPPMGIGGGGMPPPAAAAPPMGMGGGMGAAPFLSAMPDTTTATHVPPEPAPIVSGIGMPELPQPQNEFGGGTGGPLTKLPSPGGGRPGGYQGMGPGGKPMTFGRVMPGRTNR